MGYCIKIVAAIFLMLGGTSADYAFAIQQADSGGAQIPNRSPGRLACPTMKKLEAVIASLPSSEAAHRNDLNLNAEGCVWVAGEGLLPVSEPIGWRYSGEYLFLTTVVSFVDGSVLLHPAVIADRKKWRLEDECAKLDVFSTTRLIGTGEKHMYFGQRRKGFDGYCINLVDRVNEANELNMPQRNLSENWKSRPYWRNMIACRDIDGLTKSLNKMVNEQQVNNSDSATFAMKDGCIFRSVDEIVASRFIGLYQTSPESLSSPTFIVELHEVVHINKRTGVLVASLMPTVPLRVKMLKLSIDCASPIPVVSRSGKTVYLSGASVGQVEAVVIDTASGSKVAYSDLGTIIGNPRCEKQNLEFRRN